VKVDSTALVIVGLVVLVVIVALIVLSRRSSVGGRLALKALTPEARDRYLARWDEIESRFLEAPEEAVREADALILAMLGEREHPLGHERLPEGMRKARKDASRGGTEGMRVAMLHYRAVMEEMAGVPDAGHEPMQRGRREIA
jgi:hypothetical protein